VNERINLEALEQALDLYGPQGPLMLAAFKRDVRALIAELRATRKVVEKAAGVQLTAHRDPAVLYSAVVQQWWLALGDALAELEALK